MGKIDSVLQNAVNKINTEPKEISQEPSIEKQVDKKPSVEEVPQETNRDVQLDLIPKEENFEKKKFKVKAYGKEKELEIEDKDLSNYIQKGYAAEEKWKEAQETFRKAEEMNRRSQEFFENFKKDPESAMELLLGRETLDSLSEKRILRAMEMERLTPDQKEEYEVKQRLEKLKKEESEYKSKQEKIEEERKVAEFQKSFHSMTLNALKKIGYDSPSKMVMNRFLMTVRPFLENAEEPATEEDMDILANYFHKTLTEEQTDHISKMDGATIVKWLGPENVEKVRQELLKTVRSAPQAKQTFVKKEEKPTGNLRDYIKSL